MQQPLVLYQVPVPPQRRSPGGAWESRGRSPLALSAEDAAPARSGSPEGGALWRCPRRTPLRRGAGVQRAEPFGAVRGGRCSGEERESRGQSPLALSAEDAAPARSGSPEGGALWRCLRRTPLRRGAGVQRAEPFGAVCGGQNKFPLFRSCQ